MLYRLVNLHGLTFYVEKERDAWTAKFRPHLCRGSRAIVMSSVPPRTRIPCPVCGWPAAISPSHRIWAHHWGSAEGAAKSWRLLERER